MEQYKEKVRISMIICGVAAMILGVFSLLGIISETGIISLTPVVTNSHWQSMWRGIVCGASCAMMILMVAFLVRYTRGLKDEKFLKKLYVEEHDERQIQIWTAARATAMQIFLIFGLVAGIVAGYFSMTVSITILASVTFQSVIGGICKLYYSKKY
jgi:formate hydrogenlyase subunit 3/multisubunit Na+/H+ antiporter MnhD subunit